MKNEELAQHAIHVRQNIVKMLTKAGSGHPGGSLSIADILQVLYFETMHVDPKNPKKLIETASFFQKVIAHRPYMQRL